MASKINKHGLVLQRRNPDRLDEKPCLLSKNEWERITNHAAKRNIQQQEPNSNLDERRRLHELSMKRVKNWKNTVYGQSQERSRARQEKTTIEEEKRKEIDLEEALLQAQKRKLIIGKAKDQQYMQKDRLRNFHSALLLTEVLKERDAQVELKRQMKGINDDREWLELNQNELEENQRSQKEEQIKRLEKNKENLLFLDIQVKKKLSRMQEQKLKEKEEAEILKKNTEEFHEEEKEKQIGKKKEKELVKLAYLEKCQQREEMKRLDTFTNKIEEDKRVDFINKKMLTMTKISEKEKQIWDTKQDKLEKLKEQFFIKKEYLEKNNKTASSKEQMQFDKAEEELDKKFQKRIEEEKAKRQKEIDELNQHLIEQRDYLKRQKELEKNIDLDILQAQLEKESILNQKNADIRERRRRDLLYQKDVHLKQIKQREYNKQREKEANLEMNQQKMLLEQFEEFKFQEYAQNIIKDREEKGRRRIDILKRAMVDKNKPVIFYEEDIIV